MKEKSEDSFNEDSSLQQLSVTENNIEKYRQILKNKEYVEVNINNKELYVPVYINIKNTSFFKIGQMMQTYPEEIINFINKKTELYTPRRILSFTNSVINSNKEENSSFFDIKLQNSNIKSLKEEIINTDIVKSNTINVSKINNIMNIGNYENIDNIQIDNETMLNNINNIKLFSENNTNDKRTSLKNKKVTKTSADKKLVLFKWLYHFYIILSILIFCHYITFIFSEYNNNYYKWIAILLTFCLAFVGYIGIKYKYTKAPFFIFNGEYLFWVHFGILVLTIFTFSGLLTAGGHFKFISSQGVLGYIMALLYIISLTIEGIYTIYYDVIIAEINWDRNNNNMNKINEYIDNKLNIPLDDMN